jgi:hypothetical protein
MNRIKNILSFLLMLSTWHPEPIVHCLHLSWLGVGHPNSIRHVAYGLTPTCDSYAILGKTCTHAHCPERCISRSFQAALRLLDLVLRSREPYMGR